MCKRELLVRVKGFLGKKEKSRRRRTNLTFQCIKASSRRHEEFFECCGCEHEREREKTVQYFPVGIDRCPPGVGSP